MYDQTNVPVESINLNYTSKKLNLDKEEDNKVKLEYNLAPSNTSQTDVVWSSSNEAVAEVKKWCCRRKICRKSRYYNCFKG
ncbi:MAG: Ig domain-containing protein [Eubacterium ventriosum]